MNYSEMKQKLIIVHSKDTVEYANFLQLLITENDDDGETIVGVKDGTVETTVWTIKQYMDQKPKLSSSDHILFIGSDKMIDSECFGMRCAYLKYGMAYGHLGNRGFVKILYTPFSQNQINEFLHFIEGNTSLSTIGPKIEYVKKSNGWKKWRDVLRRLPCVNLISTSIDNKSSRALKAIQYTCLISLFYTEGLSRFINHTIKAEDKQ